MGHLNRFKPFLMLVTLALALVTIVSCRGSKSAKVEQATSEAKLLSDPIKLDVGYVSGTTVGDPGNEVRIVRGIPYAAPPVGELR